MSMQHVCRSLFAAVLLFAGNTVMAQKATKPGATWKKEVVRELNLQEPKDEKKHKLKSTGTDTTFAELLINAIKAGKVTAYSNYDHSFTVKVTGKEVDKMFAMPTDTMNMTDPVSGKEKMIVVTHEMDYEAIYKYRVLEEWTFNRETGNTDIHIAGVAPLIDIYNDDGTYRGSKTLFWVRYNELLPLMTRYEQSHPGKILPNYIWNDYFYTDVKPAGQSKEKIWKQQVHRVFDLDPEDTVKHHLREVGYETSLFETIEDSVWWGKLNIYDSLNVQYNTDGINAKRDTYMVVDPITGLEKKAVIWGRRNCYYQAKYEIIEEWRFDPMSGNTNVKILWFIPVLEKTEQNGKQVYEEVYRLKFEDISTILTKYEEAHPNRTLAQLLWNDHFLRK